MLVETSSESKDVFADEKKAEEEATKSLTDEHDVMLGESLIMNVSQPVDTNNVDYLL